jgi:hypothetical protein
MSEPEFVGIGGVIETVFSDGRVVRFQVNTPEQCAVANDLIMTGRWKVVAKHKRKVAGI